MINTKRTIFVLTVVFVGVFAAATIPFFEMASIAKNHEIKLAKELAVIRLITQRDETAQAEKIAADAVLLVKSNIAKADAQIKKSSAMINFAISNIQAQTALSAALVRLDAAKANSASASQLLNDARKAAEDALALQAANNKSAEVEQLVKALKSKKKVAQEAAKAHWLVVDGNKKTLSAQVVAARDRCTHWGQQNPANYKYWFDQLKQVEANALASNKADRAKGDALEAEVKRVELAVVAQEKDLKKIAKESLQNKAAVKELNTKLQTAELELVQTNQLLNDATKVADTNRMDVNERSLLAQAKVDLASAIQNEPQLQLASNQATQLAASAEREAASISQEMLLKAPSLILQAREIQQNWEAGQLNVASKNMLASTSLNWGAVGAVVATIFAALRYRFQ